MCLTWAISPADTFINDISQNLISSLKQLKNELKKDSKVGIKIANEFVLPHIDTLTMSKSVLGKKAWLSMDKAKQKEFEDAFTSMIIKTYAKSLKEFEDNTIEVKPMPEVLKSKSRVIVKSVLYAKGSKIDIKYRLVNKKDNWKIYDVVVEGISLLQNFKTQFQAQLKNTPIDGLIKKIKNV
jgi:phospholipid transport system substrate-binding protein